MIRLLTYLFLVLVLTFSFQSWTKADDIKDFQIEGIGIGDSALDLFSESTIKNQIKSSPYPNKKYFLISKTSSKFKNYEKVQFHLKSNDDKYIIHAVSGLLYFKNNVNECYKKMDEIGNELSNSVSYTHLTLPTILLV